MPSLKKDWVLTHDAFDVLLARLDEDHERAGHKYETIRHGLIMFFECHGCASPEDHADETINRVARRLLEGREIYKESPAGYFYGVARNVLKEFWESPRVASDSLESLPPERHPFEDPATLRARQAERDEDDRRFECLQHCLGGLATRERELISEYYCGETSVRIRNRKLQAARLGIQLNALRLRALRIREKLEACVHQCLERRDRSLK